MDFVRWILAHSCRLNSIQPVPFQHIRLSPHRHCRRRTFESTAMTFAYYVRTIQCDHDSPHVPLVPLVSGMCLRSAQEYFGRRKRRSVCFATRNVHRIFSNTGDTNRASVICDISHGCVYYNASDENHCITLAFCRAAPQHSSVLPSAYVHCSLSVLCTQRRR